MGSCTQQNKYTKWAHRFVRGDRHRALNDRSRAICALVTQWVRTRSRLTPLRLLPCPARRSHALGRQRTRRSRRGARGRTCSACGCGVSPARTRPGATHEEASALERALAEATCAQEKSTLALSVTSILKIFFFSNVSHLQTLYCNPNYLWFSANADVYRSLAERNVHIRVLLIYEISCIVYSCITCYYSRVCTSIFVYQ